MKKYTLKNVSQDDILLMMRCLETPNDSLFCFGKSYYKLFSLDLINEQSRVTLYGFNFLKSIVYV